jgi:hypothetical protein
VNSLAKVSRPSTSLNTFGAGDMALAAPSPRSAWLPVT